MGTALEVLRSDGSCENSFEEHFRWDLWETASGQSLGVSCSNHWLQMDCIYSDGRVRAALPVMKDSELLTIANSACTAAALLLLHEH